MFIVAAAVIVIIVVVAGLYFAGYLGGQTAATPVSIWENSGAGCTTGTDCGYNPSPLSIKAGTTARWTNNGVQPHTVTACHASRSPSATACPNGNNAAGLPDFNSGSGGLGNGQTFDVKFDMAGTYYYYCIIHPSMHGTVTVTAS